MKNVSDASGKVLIVGSDQALSLSIQENLQRSGGYESLLTTDGAQVLQILAQEHIEVVLTDQQLHTGTAFELAFEIRKERITKPEIILLSPNPELSMFEAHQVGMAHILRTPINMGELVDVMKKVIGENRRFERLHIDPKTHGELTSDIVVSATKSKSSALAVTNIGRGGFFYKVAEEKLLPEIGHIIDFKLQLKMLPETHVAGSGIVRWVKCTQEEIGVGIEFLVIPEDSERLITAFVDLFKIRQFVPSES